MKNKEERIDELAAVLDPILTKQPIPFICEVDSGEISTQLIEAGFGNLRAYRAKIIELYLKGDTAELVKFIMEEI